VCFILKSSGLRLLLARNSFSKLVKCYTVDANEYQFMPVTLCDTNNYVTVKSYSNSTYFSRLDVQICWLFLLFIFSSEHLPECDKTVRQIIYFTWPR